LSLNRSQHKRCSTENNTEISNQVVCKKSYTPALNLSNKALSKESDLPNSFGTYNGAVLHFHTEMHLLAISTPRCKSIIALSRMDSDLEAFSHKPPDVASRHYSIE
uniref:Uncharacterized protein n=1 Tax=Panagrolaimus sp. PS1159 TaxID=55785 RepID=A0AC35GWY1_9BILA